MNVINTTVLRNNLASALEEVQKKSKYLLIARKKKITSAIINIDLFEDLLSLANKKYINSIKKARKEFERGEFFTFDEVFGEI